MFNRYTTFVLCTLISITSYASQSTPSLIIANYIHLSPAQKEERRLRMGEFAAFSLRLSPEQIRATLSPHLFRLKNWEKEKTFIRHKAAQYPHINPNSIEWANRSTLNHAQEHKDVNFIIWLAQHNGAETEEGECNPFLEKATETRCDFLDPRATPSFIMESLVPLLEKESLNKPSDQTLIKLITTIQNAQKQKLTALNAEHNQIDAQFIQ